MNTETGVTMHIPGYHCKNRLVVLTAEWLPRLHAWFTLVLEANCVLSKTASFFVVSSSYLILK